MTDAAGNGPPAAVRWRGLIYQMLGIFKGIKLLFWGEERDNIERTQSADRF